MFLETVGGIVVIGIGIWRTPVQDISRKNISLHFFLNAQFRVVLSYRQ